MRELTHAEVFSEVWLRVSKTCWEKNIKIYWTDTLTMLPDDIKNFTHLKLKE